MSSPTVADIHLLNKCISKVKQLHLLVFYPKLFQLGSGVLSLYSDASLFNLSDGKSVGGYVIFFEDGDGNCCPLLWKSNTVKRVVRSTLAAETCAAVDGLNAAFFLSQMIQEILMTLPKITAFTDNKPLYKNAYSTIMVDEHRLRVDMAYIKEMLMKGELLDFFQ